MFHSLFVLRMTGELVIAEEKQLSAPVVEEKEEEKPDEWVVLDKKNSKLGTVYIHNTSFKYYLPNLQDDGLGLIREESIGNANVNRKATDLMQACLGRDGSGFHFYDISCPVVLGDALIRISNPHPRVIEVQRELERYAEGAGKFASPWLSLLQKVCDYLRSKIESLSSCSNSGLFISCALYRSVPDLNSKEAQIMSPRAMRDVERYKENCDMKKEFWRFVSDCIKKESIFNPFQKIPDCKVSYIEKYYELRLICALFGCAAWAVAGQSKLITPPPRRSTRIEKKQDEQVALENGKRVREWQEQVFCIEKWIEHTDVITSSVDSKKLKVEQ